MVIFVFKIANLACKNGGRDGLASGEPLRRRWRMAGNNDVLRKHRVLYRKSRPIDGTNPPRPQQRRGRPQARPSRPVVLYVQEHLPLADGILRRETLSVSPIGPCCWRAAEPAAPTGSHWFRRFPPSSSSLFTLRSALFPQYAPLCCSTTPNVLHNSMISSQTSQLRTYQESIWTRSS